MPQGGGGTEPRTQQDLAQTRDAPLSPAPPASSPASGVGLRDSPDSLRLTSVLWLLLVLLRVSPLVAHGGSGGKLMLAGEGGCCPSIGSRVRWVCPLCRRGGDISPTMPWGRKRVLSPVDGCESGQVECVGRKARQNTASGSARSKRTPSHHDASALSRNPTHRRGTTTSVARFSGRTPVCHIARTSPSEAGGGSEGPF